MKRSKTDGISFFERNLSLWVILCMVAGVLIGKFLPAIPAELAKFEYAKVSIPIAVLIWLMIYPMMMKVDFASIKNVGKNPTGLYVTWVVNWLIKPFTMFGIAAFFFYIVFKSLISPELAKAYLAGAVLLGAAPCTAMVFVWSHLTRGNPAYTVVQVATNDLIILIAFTPIVALLLGVGGISIPWNTLLLSVFLFVVIPLAGGITTRHLVIKNRGEDYFNKSFIPKFNNVTIGGLLLTLVLIFSFQGDIILGNPLHILLIAVPLVIQTFLIFFIGYLSSQKLKLSHDVAAPAGMIGASNFFELSVAVAITLFGASSPAVLATIVGVLVEVPVMLVLVKIANRTTSWFPAQASVKREREISPVKAYEPLARGGFGDHVLFATDFSEMAANAFTCIEQLVAQGARKVTLVHVQDKTELEQHLMGRLEEFNAQDRGRLESLKQTLLNKGASQVEIEVCYGVPFQEITRLIKERNVRLVVMGMQGRGFAGEFFLGSVSHNVARHSVAPLLLIPGLR